MAPAGCERIKPVCTVWDIEKRVCVPQGTPTFQKFGEKRRAKYLDALREGNSRSSAARSVGVSPELVRLYRKATPGWEDLETEAEEEAHGKVEDSLFKTAINGNVTACQVWLYNRVPERWKDQRNLKLMGLDDVLSRLPPDFSREVRRALVEYIPGGSGSVANGDGTGRNGPEEPAT